MMVLMSMFAVVAMVVMVDIVLFMKKLMKVVNNKLMKKFMKLIKNLMK